MPRPMREMSVAPTRMRSTGSATEAARRARQVGRVGPVAPTDPDAVGREGGPGSTAGVAPVWGRGAVSVGEVGLTPPFCQSSPGREIDVAFSYMLRYVLNETGVAAVRFGISPLSERGLSLRAIRDPSR